MIHQLRCPRDNMVGWQDHWIRRTRVWNLDRPVSASTFEVSLLGSNVRTQFSPQVVHHGCYYCFPVLWSEVHVVGWISSHVHQWPISPVLLPLVMKIEACCSFHEVVWMHCFENWWLQLLVVPTIPSFLVHKKFVVPSSHSKSKPGQDLVWSEW